MKEHLRELTEAATSVEHARNITREYLQARILASLQRAGAMVPLAFHGGTALRFLHALPRYSEDLDLALERPDAGYDLRAMTRAVHSDLSAEGYDVHCKVSDARTVHSAWVRCSGLLHELGLSPRPDRVVAIKLEIDTAPPAGAVLETTVVRRYVLLHLQHHDRASLFAGKLHALLQRPYTKGRDLFDLVWYLSDPTWPPPNLALLNAALAQTGWRGAPLTPNTWRPQIRDKLEGIAWQEVVRDVHPFVEPGGGVDLLNAETVDKLLR